MFVINQKVELTAQQGVLIYQQALQYGDIGAHEWIVEVTLDGAPYDLTGWTIQGWISRADGSTAGPMSGTGELGRATVRLSNGCYAVEGSATLILRAIRGTEKTTIAALSVRISRDTTDRIVDPERIVPDLASLLAQIEVMEEATDAAETAAALANAKAELANTAAELANAKAELANAAAELANTKAALADAKAQLADSAAADATDAAQQITDDIVPNIQIGTVTTRPAGTQASASITGTRREPLLNLSIPRGMNGTGSVSTVGGVESDGNGNVPLSINGVTADTTTGAYTLTPANLGAVPATRTVNGKALSADVVLDAEDVGAAAADDVVHSVTRYAVTFPGGSANWPYDSQMGDYACSVSVAGLTADDQATFYLDSSRLTADGYGSASYYYGQIWCIQLTAGQATARSSSIPSSGLSLPIVIEVVR